MSHELRTPLNAILGFSEVMKTEIFGPHSVPAYKDYCGDIHNSGVHLLGLINEILDLSRIEAGRYELNEEPVEPAGVVAECGHLLRRCAPSCRGLTVHEVFESGMPKLWADEARRPPDLSQPPVQCDQIRPRRAEKSGSRPVGPRRAGNI